MSQSRNSLNVGNVINAGWRLYRDNFKAYFRISLIANFWLSIPILLLIIFSLVGFGISTILPIDSYLGSLLLIALIFLLSWLFLTFYSTAKYLTNTALLSRLAFGVLMNKPETITNARQHLKPKTWQFWLTQFIVGMILFVVNWAGQILQIVFFSFPAKQIENQQLKTIIELLGYLFYLIVYIWFYARLFIPEVPLAIENNLKVGDPVSRSWKLTGGFAWRLILIIFVVILITCPVYLLSGIPLVVAAIYAVTGLINGVQPLLILSVITYGFLAAILIFLLLNIAILPFWQTVKSVVYYDLRSRQEGIHSISQEEDPYI